MEKRGVFGDDFFNKVCFTKFKLERVSLSIYEILQ